MDHERNEKAETQEAGSPGQPHGFVIFSMALVVNARSSSLRAKDLEYQVREENLRAQVEEEKKRAEDLEEKRVYVQTKQYIEKVAKEKLGLVNPDEIMLKAAN